MKMEDLAVKGSLSLSGKINRTKNKTLTSSQHAGKMLATGGTRKGRGL